MPVFTYSDPILILAFIVFQPYYSSGVVKVAIGVLPHQEEAETFMPSYSDICLNDMSSWFTITQFIS